MANEIMKVKSSAALYAESAWGTKPGSPVYVDVPVLSCVGKFNREMIQADAFTGLLVPKHAEPKSGNPQVALSLPPFGFVDPNASVSIMEYLFSWIFGDLETTATASKGIQWAEGPDVSNKEWNGLRINSATIQGSADTGFVTVDLDLIGKTEALLGTARTVPNDRNKMYLPLFRNVVWSIAGTPVDIKQFSITVSRNLKSTFLNGFSPAHCLASKSVLAAQCTLVKNADTYDAYRRATSETEVALSCAIKAPHNGTGSTGTLTVSTLAMARASLLDVNEEGGKDDLAMQPLNFAVLKPDSSTAAIVNTMGEA